MPRKPRVIAALGVLVLFALSAAAQEARWKELDAQAEQLQKQGKYAEALPVAQEALRVAEATFGSQHPKTAAALEKLGEVYQAKGKYAEAEPIFKRSLAIREKALGPEHPDVAKGLNNLAYLYYEQGNYAEAEPLYKRSLAIREKALGPEHPDVAKSLINLAILYDEQGNYAEAEPLYKRSLAIQEKALGPEHPDVALSLNNLADLYEDQGKYAEAEPLYKRSLAIREKALGPEHPDVAQSLNNLANLYRNQGKYAEAEPLCKRSLAIREKALGPGSPEVAKGLFNLATLYYKQGNYAEAEPLSKRSLAIFEKALGPEHPYVATSLGNLAIHYDEQGNYAEAEPLYKRSLAIWEKALGPEHPDVATSLNNLANLYYEQGKYSEAEPLYKRSLAIREKALGPEHPEVADSLDNLAILYANQGNYAEAEPLDKRSLAIREKALGPEHPDVALSLDNLAALYRDQGKYAEAEPLYKRSLAIREKALGPEHPDVAESLNNWALLYRAEGKYAQAEPLFERSLRNVAGQFEKNFTYMSERDRLLFLDKVSDFFPTYFSFCLAYREQDPLLAGTMYNVLLWQKGLIASSITSLRAQIAATGDKQALAHFQQLTAKKTQLATLLTAEPKDREVWRKNVEQLEQETNDMEKALVERSSALAEKKKLAQATWRDVAKALGKDEAAVEFVRFRFHDGKRLTETADYAALIVTPETTTAPTLVKLGEAKALEARPIEDYRRRAGLSESSDKPAGQSFYEAFWKPLENTLKGKKRIYISPDGVLNQVALGIVPAADGRPLIEKYDLRLVSSTKDILRARRRPTAESAVLIGAPQFDLDETKQRELAQSFHKKEAVAEPVLVASASGLRSSSLQRGGLAPLPGAKVELQEVSSLLTQHHWQVEAYSGEDALEERVKRVQGPRVLHLATHGFFLPDEERLKGSRPAGAEDPMLRSGLFFAGANRVISNVQSSQDLDDGVLTAYEASGLNLQGTELVVLSACQTGLGEVKNGEGVFGLRRALQEAGAESVLMSLWAVPDRETQELMTLFYGIWLSGKDKYEALREAQLEMRARVKARYGIDLPFYWGGFVLVGR